MRRTVVALALAVFVLAGCEPKITREVLLVGDSVTSESSKSIVQSFNHVAVNAKASRFAPVFGSVVSGQGLLKVPAVPRDKVDEFWTKHVASLMAHVHPEVIVVELGYNDCDHLRDLATYGSRIDGFMAQIPRSVPVHWLTVADPKKRRQCDEIINTQLLAATVRHSNMTLLDFARFMNKHPEWTPDGVHPNAQGQKQYALWLHGQLTKLYPER